MSTLNQLKPLVLGPFFRALAIYIEIVTFSLTLLSEGGILSVVSFSVLGVLGIADIVLCIRSAKAQKVSRLLDQNIEMKPKVGVIMFDIVFGTLFLISWGSYMYIGGHRYYSYYFGSYNVFGAFVLIGDLSIAHVHIFMGSIAAHTLRQQKNGREAAHRAHDRDRSRHGDGVVELAEPVGETVPRTLR